jgi:hypothetical protein
MTDLAPRIADVKKKAEAEIIADKAMRAATEDEGYDAVQRKVKDWGKARNAYTTTASPDLILAMAARIEELEKALEPFANGWKDDISSPWFFTFEEIEAAARALEGEADS